MFHGICRPSSTSMLRLVSGQWHSTNVDVSDADILFRSNDFIVINKRYDIKINSDDPDDAVTVATQLNGLCPESVDKHTAHGFRFVHRLDYATSGCLCVALTKKGARWGNKAFSKRYVTKHYLALVRGHTDKPVTIRQAIGCDTSVTDVHKMCTSDSATCSEPRDAETLLVPLEIGHYSGEPATKVLLVPHTGRTHQLRVHCRTLGYCIVGDYMYSNREDVTPYRMMLHALRLVIPMKREHIDVTAGDPFIPSLDPLWQPSKTLSTYQAYVDGCQEQNSPIKCPSTSGL